MPFMYKVPLSAKIHAPVYCGCCVYTIPLALFPDPLAVGSLFTGRIYVIDTIIYQPDNSNE